jgi:hypothetical protein
MDDQGKDGGPQTKKTERNLRKTKLEWPHLMHCIAICICIFGMALAYLSCPTELVPTRRGGGQLLGRDSEEMRRAGTDGDRDALHRD